MHEPGMLLRVNLTDKTILREQVPAEWREKYLGGEGVNARLLWEHFLGVDPAIDPLSPDNVLIIGTGPLAGTGFGAGSKMKFTFKSPAYNLYGDTSSRAGLGSQLIWSGYDHVVITGKAEHPVYLWVNDDRIEIRDATHLWGMSAHETDNAIKRELDDDRVEVACIGPGGENLVRFASIMVDSHGAGGRGGGGCVFGSKNLKAIAALGTKGASIHDPDAFFRATDEFLAAIDRSSPKMQDHMRFGTLTYTRTFHGPGFNTFRNGQGVEQMPDEATDKLDHHWYTKNMGVRNVACSPGCAFGCGSWYHIKGNETPAAKKYAGEWGTKPEYGATNPFGAACDIRDLPAVAHLNAMCNHYGMDTMEVGMSISFLMELWERGILTQADIAEWTGESFTLEWGNHLSAEKVLDCMGLQSNRLGELLNGGVYQTALRLGELKGMNLLRYASYGKAGATHEGPVRPVPKLGLACALAPIGAHHLKGLGIGSPELALKYLGNAEAAAPVGVKWKGASHAVGEHFTAITNCLGICFFLWKDPELVPLEIIAKALEAVTGIPRTADDLYLAGERVANIQKAFNSRLGLRREHDTVCERWLNEPHMVGVAKGMKVGDYLEGAKDDYYQWRGWDLETSLQSREKLEQLGMLDVAEVLENENALVRIAARN